MLLNKTKVFTIIRKSKQNYRSASLIKKANKNYFPIFFKKNSELENKISKIKIDTFINLATSYIPHPKYDEMSPVMDSNIIFPTLMLDICCKSKVKKIINICSVMQCDKNKMDNPLNFYALTKILFKKTMSYYQKIYQNKIFLNLFIGDTYGSNDNRKKILPMIIKNYKKNKNTKILTRKLYLNILHVKDIINAIKILIDKEKKSQNYI